MHTDTKSGPYTPDQLYAQAQRLAIHWGIPLKWREDAMAEFVAAAVAAVGTAKDSVRTHQHRCGRDALLKYFRRESRAETRRPAGSLSTGKRLSFDMPVPGMDGEPTTLAETIRDRSAPDPGDRMRGEDLKKAVAHALSRLTPEEAEAARRVFIDGETQEAAAEAMKLTRNQLRARIASALPILRIWLADYRDLAGK